MARSKSSKSWLREHQHDPFVRQARELGYRSRAVFKLIELQQKDNLLKPGAWVLDLGAAPGGWSEYVADLVGRRGRVIAVDLLAMDSVAGVEFIQGDFREADTLDRLTDLLGEHRLDLVLSDMAPNLTGMESLDQPRILYLAELAFALARQYLKPQATLVMKLFQGQGFDELIAQLRLSFKSVKLRKPAASRSRSKEIYAVCVGLRASGAKNLR